MTIPTDKVLALAKEAGFSVIKDEWVFREMLERFAALIQQQIIKDGWRSPEWISCEVRLPDSKTPVLAVVCGTIRKAELRWDNPGYEDTYPAFKYWDDPDDDGQDWEWSDVTHWMPLPNPPSKERK